MDDYNTRRGKQCTQLAWGRDVEGARHFGGGIWGFVVVAMGPCTQEPEREILAGAAAAGNWGGGRVVAP